MKLATTATLALVTALSAGSASAMTTNDTGHQFNELASAAVGKNINASTWASSVSSIQENPFVEVVSLSDLGDNFSASDVVAMKIISGRTVRLVVDDTK